MLQRLTEVQAFDLQIDSLHQERDQVPPELTALSAKRDELQRRLEVKRLEVDDLRRKVNTNELELKAMGERRRSATDSAMRASSAKEAAQYQNQELQFATRVQELEEDTLPLMESQETVTDEHDALRAELDELLPTLDDMRLAEEARVADVDARIESTRRERVDMAAGIDASLLKQYDQIRTARRGVGVVEIVDNASCGGCSVRLPIHILQKARKGAGVTRCPSCGRILRHKAAA
ncbi:MAG TPA: C4-type zinc ribbon domain-containing protein [Trueperaceae bacterium]|nr:C4-type zinc ribbon domain-containing protein [Trueperaceae bacterium]